MQASPQTQTRPLAESLDERRLTLRATGLLCLYLACAAGLIGALQVLLPGTFTLALPWQTIVMEDFANRVSRAALVPALVLPAVFLVELLFVGWQDASLRALLTFSPRETFRSDIVMTLLLRTPLWRVAQWVLTFGLFALSGAAVHDAIRGWLGWDFSLAHLPLPLTIVAWILLDTFFDYWDHRIEHMSVFWPIHRFHHAALEFSVLTADRVHPGNFVSTILSGFVLGFVQVPFEVFAAYMTATAALRYLIHTRIDSDWGWVGRWLVLSPGHHRAHHARDFDKANCNFGLLVLWDALFGTLRPAVRRSEPIGLDSGPTYRHGWWVVPDLLRDTGHTLRNVAGLFAGRIPRV